MRKLQRKRLLTHDLGSVDIEYTGTLELVSAGAGGAILRMPPSAAGSETYTAAWSGPCGSSARLQVSLLYDETGRCLAPGEGCGCPPAAVSIVSNEKTVRFFFSYKGQFI